MSHFIISEDLKALFLQRLEESVTQGDTIQYIKSRKSTTTVRNGEGEIIRVQETISEERNTTLMKATPQAIPILDRALSVEAAMNLLTREGYVVLDPTMKPEEDESNKPKGLSPQLIEEIKCKLLGFEPEELDSRLALLGDE